MSAELDAYQAAGASIMVLAAETGVAGYDQRHELDAEGWHLFGRNLDTIVKAAADQGIQAVVHPHVGTMIETTSDVNRVLNDTAANLCLDTGHLLIGGTDPGQLARDYAARIGHTHLKDVRKAVAERVQNGEISYTDGVKTGMYVPLGQGDVGIADIVLHPPGGRIWRLVHDGTGHHPRRRTGRRRARPGCPAVRGVPPGPGSRARHMSAVRWGVLTTARIAQDRFLPAMQQGPQRRRLGDQQPQRPRRRGRRPLRHPGRLLIT